MPNYFKPELNKPYTLALKYPSGTPVSGNAGPELRWILSDGRALYTPLDFADKLKAIGISKPGQRFQAERRTKGRKAEWLVTPTSNESLATHVPDLRGPQKAAAILEAAGALDAPESEIKGNHRPDRKAPATALEIALKTAVAAAAAAEKHAEGLGYSCRFSSADIRAMGISVLIGLQSGRAA